MRLARALVDKKFDVRLSDKFVADNKITQKELEDYKNSLPDDADKATTTGEVEEAKASEASQNA